MKIAHISDLHLSDNREIIYDVEKKIAAVNAAKVEHLIITGDLTQSGQEVEFQLLLHLLESNGFNSSERLTVIPGNHDLFRFFFSNFHLPKDFYGKFHKVPQAVLQVLAYSKKNYEADLSIFNSNFNGVLEKVITLEEESVCGYPFIKVLNKDVALIAFESNYLLPKINKNAVCSNGFIEPISAEKILSQDILSNKIKIVVMHHHLLPESEVVKRNGKWFSETMKLINREEITELFKKYEVDLVLHGHYHYQEEYFLDDCVVKVVNNGDNSFGSLISVRNGKIEVQSKFLQ